ncbi:MAG TPA: Gfo/Idh/MocA family oxidoreductase [Polyangiaceae bacterium]|nr:Gfo/Idh/MocA family oxidoreductase [Polyangiaceae bacterium]
MKPTLNWGVVGTGGIAVAFVDALRKSKRCRVVNVAGSSAEKAKAFSAQWGLPRASGSLQELLADPAVEAVYIASPHPFHEAQALAAIAAKKAVLCEKPLTVDIPSTERLIEAARRNGVFLMEAFMYRCHPLLREVVSRLKDGAIGRIRHVRASFGFRVPRDPSGRLFNLELGGGSILDVGGYPVSFARLVAGLIEGKPFAEPVQIQACGVIGPTGADELATALLTFSSGFTAEAVSATFHAVGTHTVVYGEEGRIELPDPWIPRGQRQGLESEFTVYRDGREPETVSIRTELATYGIEAELVADTLPATEVSWPAMSWADTLGNMRVMEAWRAQLGSKST